jgi:uncharacterized membrane protein
MAPSVPTADAAPAAPSGREDVAPRAGRGAWLRGHPTVAAALVYALLTVVLYGAALVPGHTLSASDFLWSAAPWAAERPADVEFLGSNLELADPVLQFEPYARYARDRLPDAPLWNPHVGAGRPFLANAQSAVLSPFSLPSYLLPFWWSLGLVAALKVFVAAFGTHLLARALGIRFAGALMAGLVFAFSLFFLVWVPWPHTNVWALLPWLLLLTERVLRAPTPLTAAGLAGVVALQFFGGHPESNFHLLAVTVAFFALRLVVLRREASAQRAGPAAIAFAGALAAGGALAAITLLPFLELLTSTNDVAVRRNYWRLSMPREYLLGFALPDYWGRGTQTSVGAFAQGRALYAGALPLVLAGAAVALRPSLQRLGVAAFGAVMLAIVVGLPPLPELASHVPIVRTGNHVRLVVVVMLCLALLSGWGLDDVARGAVRRRAALLGLAGVLLVAPLLVLAARGQLSADVLGRALSVAWGFAAPPSSPFDPEARPTIRMASLVVWLTVMGTAIVLLGARLTGRLGVTAFTALAVALVAGDLFRAGMGQTPAIATSTATQPSTPALRYLREQRPDRFVGLERALGPSPVPPNIAMREGLFDARSYDVPVERRYDRLWRRAIRDGSPTEFPTTNAVLTRPALPALRLLSVTDVVQDPAERRIADPALPLAYDGRDARIYANRGALPRVGVVGSQRVAPSEEAQLAAVLEPGFDGRTTVVTERTLPGLRTTPAAGPAGSARIVTYEPERVVVEATASRPAELVLTDVHYPGWKVTLDGEPADLHRVDYLLRGTTLPAGSHRVEFRYEPLSWRLGWIVSLVSLIALAAAVATALRRRRPGAAD